VSSAGFIDPNTFILVVLLATGVAPNPTRFFCWIGKGGASVFATVCFDTGEANLRARTACEGRASLARARNSSVLRLRRRAQIRHHNPHKAPKIAIAPAEDAETIMVFSLVAAASAAAIDASSTNPPTPNTIGFNVPVGDTDLEEDIDNDGDTETVAETDSVGDADSEADSDSEAETDSEGDTDSDGDTDSEADTDSEHDGEDVVVRVLVDVRVLVRVAVWVDDDVDVYVEDAVCVEVLVCVAVRVAVFVELCVDVAVCVPVDDGEGVGTTGASQHPPFKGLPQGQSPTNPVFDPSSE
jgi:hypothetical protein